MAGTSIGYQLGIGSGLDIKSLVDNLAAAAKSPKEAQLVKREEANAARVSQLAQVSQGIDSFASALASLVSGGTLYSQPSLSDSSVLSASAIRGARLAGLPASIEVTLLWPRRCPRRPSRADRPGRPGRPDARHRDRHIHCLDHRRQRQSRRPRQGDQRRRRGCHRDGGHRRVRRPAGAEGRDRRRQCLHPVGAERHRLRAGALCLRSRCHWRHEPRAGGAERGADRRRRAGRAGDEQLQRPDRRRPDRSQARRAGRARFDGRRPPRRGDQPGDERFRRRL